ncbi:MAG: fatty acid--CoA ligase [Candidatus Dormibacteria bacterium]
MRDEPMTFTLTELIRELAQQRPGAPAVTFENHTLDFAALDARSDRFAAALAAAGVGPGDRVGHLEKNSAAFFEILFGCSKAGAVLVALNWRLAPPEVSWILRDARVSVLFAGEEQLPLVEAEAIPPAVVVMGDDYETWLAAGDGVPPGHETSPEDTILQLYSSGTTGRPKGAMLTHSNLGYTVRLGREGWGMSASTVNLISSPLFHVGGAAYSLTALGQGGHTVILRAADPAGIVRAVSEYRVTHSWFVPTVIQSILDEVDAHPSDLSSLELIGYGGAPISEPLLLRALSQLNCRFLGVYGMTETASTVLVLAPEDHDPGGPRAHLLRSVGRPPSWVEIAIRDAFGNDLPPGQDGEIWARSGQNMRGYWNQPEATAQTLVGDGWLRTGDAAHRDEDGYVFLHDRIKDMIISGGENIYPAEIESILAGHPGVVEVAVIAVPHERWGETPRAMVVPREGSVLEAAELIEYTRARLAKYKCPTSVEFVDALPRNASGKVLKHVLRQPFWPAPQPTSS